MAKLSMARVTAIVFFTLTIISLIALSVPIFATISTHNVSEALSTEAPFLEIYLLACIVLIESVVVFRWFQPAHPRVYKFLGIAALLVATITAALANALALREAPSSVRRVRIAPTLGYNAPALKAVPGSQRLLSRPTAVPEPRVRSRRRHLIALREEAAPPEPSVDDLLSQMATAPMTLTTPPTMQRDSAANVTLILDPSKTLAELLKQADPNSTKGYTVRFAKRMQATLSGDGFSITPSDPSVQAVTEETSTQWQWSIRALKKGSQRLEATLDALLMVDGSSTPRTIRTFSQTITVEVTTPQIVGDFFKSIWQWLWASILVPLAGWITRQKPPAAPNPKPRTPRASARLGDS